MQRHDDAQRPDDVGRLGVAALRGIEHRLVNVRVHDRELHASLVAKPAQAVRCDRGQHLEVHVRGARRQRSHVLRDLHRRIARRIRKDPKRRRGKAARGGTGEQGRKHEQGGQAMHHGAGDRRSATAQAECGDRFGARLGARRLIGSLRTAPSPRSDWTGGACGRGFVTRSRGRARAAELRERDAGAAFASRSGETDDRCRRIRGVEVGWWRRRQQRHDASCVLPCRLDLGCGIVRQRGRSAAGRG